MVKVEITRQHVDNALSLAMHISPTGTEQQVFLQWLIECTERAALITMFSQLYYDPWMME